MTDKTDPNNGSDALARALYKLLRPLVRILLRNGMAFNDFSAIAKRAYVDVAHQEFQSPGRKQSHTHVAVLTGVHRREVKNILLQPPVDERYQLKHNRAARVISGWLGDEQFTRNGKPLALDLQGDFVELVNRYGGDVTPRTVFDELERIEAIYCKGDTVSLVVDAYTPADGKEELVEVFGDSVCDLLETMSYNLITPSEKRRVQMSVVHNNLPDEVMDDVGLVCQEKAMVFLRSLNDFVCTQDRDSNPAVKGTGRNRAGIGLYYFEEKFQVGDE